MSEHAAFCASRMPTPINLTRPACDCRPAPPDAQPEPATTDEALFADLFAEAAGAIAYLQDYDRDDWTSARLAGVIAELTRELRDAIKAMGELAAEKKAAEDALAWLERGLLGKPVSFHRFHQIGDYSFGYFPREVENDGTVIPEGWSVWPRERDAEWLVAGVSFELAIAAARAHQGTADA